MNGDFYVLVLTILQQHISRKPHEMESGLQHDNARPEVDIFVQQFFSKCNSKMQPYPHLTPYLAL